MPEFTILHLLPLFSILLAGLGFYSLLFWTALYTRLIGLNIGLLSLLLLFLSFPIADGPVLTIISTLVLTIVSIDICAFFLLRNLKRKYRSLDEEKILKRLGKGK